jgi:nucleoside-diphosphate-sugar epimerase
MDLLKQKILVIGKGVVGSRVFARLEKLKPSLLGSYSRDGYVSSGQLDAARVVKDCKSLSIFENPGDILRTPWDVVVYTAGYWKGRNRNIIDFSENVEPLLSVFSNIKFPPKRILYFSSSAVYGLEENDESNELFEFPDNTYGAAKIYSESVIKRFCESLGSSFIIFRPFHITSNSEIFRPGRSHVLTDLIYKRFNNIKIVEGKSFSDTYIPFTWVDDCVDAVLAALSIDLTNTVYNIGSRYEYSLHDALKLIDRIIEGDSVDSLELQRNMRITNKFDRSFRLLGDYDGTPLFDQVRLMVSSHRINISN